MNSYAIYFGAAKVVDGRWCHLNSLGVVMAANQDEAVGKAHRIRDKVYPPSKGWSHPNASAIRTDGITDIDDWQEYRGLD